MTWLSIRQSSASAKSFEILSCGCFARDRGDVTGQRFGRLTAITVQSKDSKTKWRCQCDCGNFTVTRLDALRSGATQSCGCRKAETDQMRSRTHGKTGTFEHICWQNMHQRCRTPARRDYKYYGGRGIRVCSRWAKFENFLADMGECPPGYSIERIDVNGNYEPANCKWIPIGDQSNNTRRTARR
jgi:hypothetical protein